LLAHHVLLLCKVGGPFFIVLEHLDHGAFLHKFHRALHLSVHVFPENLFDFEQECFVVGRVAVLQDLDNGHGLLEVDYVAVVFSDVLHFGVPLGSYVVYVLDGHLGLLEVFVATLDDLHVVLLELRLHLGQLVHEELRLVLLERVALLDRKLLAHRHQRLLLDVFDESLGQLLNYVVEQLLNVHAELALLTYKLVHVLRQEFLLLFVRKVFVERFEVGVP